MLDGIVPWEAQWLMVVGNTETSTSTTSRNTEKGLNRPSLLVIQREFQGPNPDSLTYGYRRITSYTISDLSIWDQNTPYANRRQAITNWLDQVLSNPLPVDAHLSWLTTCSQHYVSPFASFIPCYRLSRLQLWRNSLHLFTPTSREGYPFDWWQVTTPFSTRVKKALYRHSLLVIHEPSSSN